MASGPRQWVIYILRDPRDLAIRYVGVTHNPQTRLTEHKSKSRVLRHHTATWVKSLLRDKLEPVFETVEEGSGETWADREVYWIAYYKGLGCRLTNHTDGGEGTLGWSPTAEQRAKMGLRAVKLHTGKKRTVESRQRMREAQIRANEERKAKGIVIKRPPKSPETIKRMSEAQKGKKASAETRKKLSKSHSNPSLETREKLSKAVLDRPKETRDAFALNRLGTKQTPEHRAKISAARKAYWLKRKEGTPSQG